MQFTAVLREEERENQSLENLVEKQKTLQLAAAVVVLTQTSASTDLSQPDIKY